jgi:hypothetical protein
MYLMTCSVKKLALVTIATTINAGLILCAGPLSKVLRLPRHILPFYLLGIVVSWYAVFAVMLFFASPSALGLRERAARVFGESTIAMVIFCAVLLYHTMHIIN